MGEISSGEWGNTGYTIIITIKDSVTSGKNRKGESRTVNVGFAPCPKTENGSYVSIKCAKGECKC